MRREQASSDPASLPPKRRVFISYAREDSGRVDKLQRSLEAAGIPVWRDIADLWPGEDWRAKIRDAIAGDALVFIACFSRASLNRHASYQNEELLLAAAQLRLRRPGEPWLIPVRLDECEIPDLDIGGGRTLAAVQRVDLFGDSSDLAAARLIAAVVRMLGRDPADASALPSPSRPARSYQAGWTRPRRPASRPITAVTAALIAAVLLATGAYLALRVAQSQGSTLVTGSVVCESGRPVTGVWIAASSGQDDSGLAHLGPPGSSGISYPIGSAGTYSFRLAHGGSYAVHVGCGGTARRWASSNYSPLLSSTAVLLLCHDPTSAGNARGQCSVAGP